MIVFEVINSDVRSEYTIGKYRAIPLSWLIRRLEFGDGEICVRDHSGLSRNDIHMRTILGNSFLDDGSGCGDPRVRIATRRAQELAQEKAL